MAAAAVLLHCVLIAVVSAAPPDGFSRTPGPQVSECVSHSLYGYSYAPVAQQTILEPGESVTIQTPNYPMKFNAQTWCRWRLKSSTNITITCSDLLLQSENNDGMCLRRTTLKYEGSTLKSCVGDTSVLVSLKARNMNKFKGFYCTATAESDTPAPNTSPTTTESDISVPITSPIPTEPDTSVPNTSPIPSESETPVPNTSPTPSETETPVPNTSPFPSESETPVPNTSPTPSETETPVPNTSPTPTELGRSVQKPEAKFRFEPPIPHELTFDTRRNHKIPISNGMYFLPHYPHLPLNPIWPSSTYSIPLFWNTLSTKQLPVSKSIPLYHYNYVG